MYRDWRSRGKNLGRVQGPLVNPRRPIVRRGRRGRDSETVTCRLNVTEDSRLFHSLPEQQSSSCSSPVPSPGRANSKGRNGAMSFARFRLVSLREMDEKKEFDERKREESIRIYSLRWWTERARRPMSLGGAEGSPTLN